MNLVRAARIASVLCVASTVAQAQLVPEAPTDTRTSLGVTVYQDGFAVVRDARTVEFGLGRHTIRFIDIGDAVQYETLDITTSGPGEPRLTAVAMPLERLTRQALLARFEGRTVDWISENPATGQQVVRQATVLAAGPETVLSLDGRIEVDPPGRPAFPSLPDDLAVAPAFDLNLTTAAAGPVEIAARFVSGGFAWRADYVASLDEREETLTVEGHATLTNRSGMALANAAVVLFAGSVNRVSDAPAPPVRLQRGEAMAMAADVMPEAAPVFDHYSYRLPDRVDLPDGVVKRVPLFPPAATTVRKIYRLEGGGRFHGRPAAGEVDPVSPEIVLAFRNAVGDGPGRPLPAGVVRIYGPPGDTPTLLGEDRIDHTPEGEEIRLAIGRAFDVRAERRQTDFQRTDQRGGHESAYEVVIRNARDTGATVEVVEALPGEWRILSESQPHVRRDAGHAVWNVSVPAKGEARLTFRAAIRP